MKYQSLFTLSFAVSALAAPIANLQAERDVADVATVLIGVAKKPNSVLNRDVADVATVLIGVGDKRDVAEGLNKRDVADVATVLIGVAGKRDSTKDVVQRDVADVATVLIGVSGRGDGGLQKREPAVQGAYAKFVKEAEEHPEDILG